MIQKWEKLTDIYKSGGSEKLEQIRDQYGVWTAYSLRQCVISVWTYDPEQSLIRRQKIAGKDTIGDIRISFTIPTEYATGK